MTGVFINLGEGFKDDKLNLFRKHLGKRMEVISFNYAREMLGEINALPKEEAMLFYFETNVCRKNKNYIKAFCNLISCISKVPSTVYLMPAAPKEIVSTIREHWPICEIYQFEYDIMKSSVLIPRT